MNGKTVRRYVLIPALGLIAIANNAFADGAPMTPNTLPAAPPANAAVDCRVAAQIGPAPGELRSWKITDYSNTYSDTSKVRNNFKLLLQSVFQKIESYYGPLQAKSRILIGFKWDDVKRDFQDQVPYLKTQTDQLALLSDVSYKHFRDAHIAFINNNTDHVKLLPIAAEAFDGKVMISAIADSYPSDQPAMGLSDEIVSINGMTPLQFMHQAPVWNARGNEDSNLALFANELSGWQAAGGLPPSLLALPGLDFTMRKQGSSQTYQVHLKFTEYGIGVDGSVKGPPIPQQRTAIKPNRMRMNIDHVIPHTARISRMIHKMMKATIDQPVLKISAKRNWKGRPGTMGAQDGDFTLPPTFQKLTIPDQILQSPLGQFIAFDYFTNVGTFQQDGKTYGFIRIPQWESDTEPLQFVVAAQRLYMGMFEKLRASGKIDGLFIDQMSNPGGWVSLSDQFVRTLGGGVDPDQHIRYAVKPTPDFMGQWQQIRNAIAANQDGNIPASVISDLVKRMDADYLKIKKAHDGFIDPTTKEFVQPDLSEPVSMLPQSEFDEAGVSAFLAAQFAQQIQIPNPKNPQQPTATTVGAMAAQAFGGIDLTKPARWGGNKANTFMLINAKDASGADCTPFTADEQGLVTLVGVGSYHTMGAGGTVIEHSIVQTKDVDITLHLTESLMVGNTGNLVENHGATAKIKVPMLPSDLVDGGVTVLSRIVKAIETAATGK